MTLSAHSPLAIGQEVGKYTVVKLLGQGGMGMVFEVRHKQLGTRAAMKILWTEREITKELASRFLTEARAAAHIDHPGVVKVFEYDQLADGTPYLIMEFLSGQTLGERLEQVATTPARCLGLSGLGLLSQIAATLADIHKRGIVHRDLKPGNIMLVPDSAVAGRERVKILDFGIAKVLSAEAVGLAAPAVHTRTGAMLGTPHFMSPEQWAGIDVDDKADCYALGVIAYQVLVGRVALDADNPMALMFKHATSAPTPLDQINPALPASLVDLVGRMLRKNKGERPSMSAIETALHQIIQSGQHQPAEHSSNEPLPQNSPKGLLASPDALTLKVAVNDVGRFHAAALIHAPTVSLPPSMAAVYTGSAFPTGDPAKKGRISTVQQVIGPRGMALLFSSLIALCGLATWKLLRVSASQLSSTVVQPPATYPPVAPHLSPIPQQAAPPSMALVTPRIPLPAHDDSAQRVQGRAMGIPPLRSALATPIYPTAKTSPIHRQPQPYVPPTVD